MNYIVFGKGNNFYPYMERIIHKYPVRFFSDNNKEQYMKLNDTYGLEWIEPKDIKTLKNVKVLIMVDKQENIEQISKQLARDGIEFCHVKDCLNDIDIFPEKISWLSRENEQKIVRFIDINVSGTNMCNFKCAYCFVWRKKDFIGGTKSTEHTPKQLREALSRKKMGGRCFINFCAKGETFLADNIVEILRELLEEGHYVAIVTNGTIRKKILEVLQFPKELQDRMFFKMSFHYHELEKRNLMSVYWENVRDIRNSHCSYTLEITPYDGLIKDIEKIKSMFCEKEERMLPHISYARDSKKQGLDALTDYSKEEYQRIWGQFDSKMFSLKSDWYGKHIEENCYAGSWSYRVDLTTGSIQNCYGNESIGNIFAENQTVFPVKTICKECKQPYCFNAHAFLAWGVVPTIDCYSYLDMRDRNSANGRHWVKAKMRNAFSTKLGRENFHYIGRWSDYERLYNRSSKPAIIVFNSPDYRNLGDHAIALGEKSFFERNFPEYEVIEVSCQQYAIENARLKNCIRKDDIIAITGGGNFGSLYLYLQDMTIDVIESFPDNRVVIMPQSLYFEDTTLGRYEKQRAKKAIEMHQNVLVCLRDDVSYKRAKDMFAESVELLQVPDMAFYMDVNREGLERKGAILCLRDDQEQNNVDRKKIEELVNNRFDNVVQIKNRIEKNVYLDTRREEVQKRLNEIASSEFVVTDCLHTMIFCALTETPCAAFDNSYGKVSALYNSMGALPFVRMCESVEDIESLIKGERLFGEEDDVKAINVKLQEQREVFCTRLSKE